MSTYEELFIRHDGSVDSEARALAEDLGMSAVEHDGRIHIRRAASDGVGQVGGEVYRNNFLNPELEGEAQAFDGYSTVFAIWTTDRSLAKQSSEALQIFRELVVKRPDTAMVLTHDLDLITAAYVPGLGSHEFPEGTTADVDDEPVWRPWVADSPARDSRPQSPNPANP
jgi:hypothetical protein